MADLSRCPTVPTGCNRRDLDREVLRLGGRVRIVPGQGEVEYSHPIAPVRVRFNGRKKTPSMTATRWVEHLRRMV